MPNATFGKLVALVFLAVAASVATSKIMSFAGASQPPTPPGDTEVMGTTTIVRPGDPPSPAVKDLGKNIASGAMNRFETTVQGRTVLVDAKATIQDTRPNMQFVWAVRVFAPGDKSAVLFEKTYEDQVFSLDDEEPLEMSFLDKLEIPLSAGKYTLELTWFGLPPEQGLLGLNDPVTRNLYKGAAGTSTVEIGP